MTRWVSHFIDYCKFGNFRENFVFANSVKRRICDIKNRDYGMIHLINKRQSGFAFSHRFYFHETSHAKFSEKKTLAKVSKFTGRLSIQTATEISLPNCSLLLVSRLQPTFVTC